MNPTSHLELLAHELHRWDGAPIRLRVLSGRLWVTQTDDLQDHFLDPGDSAVFAGPRIVVQAETHVRCTFEAVASSTSWTGALRRLAWPRMPAFQSEISPPGVRQARP